ncbi:MAG: flagellar biosynthesis anti-sigma factor FlgM [Myxococcota bacterium]
MKIDAQRANGTPVGADRTAAAQTAVLESTKRPKSAGADRRADQVALSDGAADLAESVGAIAETLESERNADPERVSALRRQVSQGTYPQQLRALAQELVKSEESG